MRWLPHALQPSVADHGRDRPPHADLPWRGYERLDQLGSTNGRATSAPEGTPIMHVEQFVRGGSLMPYALPAHRGAQHPPVPAAADHRPHPVAVQRGTDRRNANVVWHDEDKPRSIRTTPSSAASRTETGRHPQPRGRDGDARGADRTIQPGVVYTTFHHPFPANVITTDNSDWATNCPEYKVTWCSVARRNRRNGSASSASSDHQQQDLLEQRERVNT